MVQQSTSIQRKNKKTVLLLLFSRNATANASRSESGARTRRTIILHTPETQPQRQPIHARRDDADPTVVMQRSCKFQTPGGCSIPFRYGDAARLGVCNFLFVLYLVSNAICNLFYLGPNCTLLWDGRGRGGTMHFASTHTASRGVIRRLPHTFGLVLSAFIFSVQFCFPFCVFCNVFKGRGSLEDDDDVIWHFVVMCK